ncbi:thioredoxin family protein [Microbacteriaceae bacterium 4G12]
MIEWTGDEVVERVGNDELVILYIYTPLCGTCQVAKKMMAVIDAALPSLEIGMIDLNYAPDLAMKYAIESVPCLLLFERGEIVKRIYAFQSVEYLYHELKSFAL